MQTLVTHTRDPAALVRDLGPWRAAHVLSLFVAHTLGPALGVWWTAYVLHAAAFDQRAASGWEAAVLRLWVGLALAGVVSLAAPTCVGLVRRGLWSNAAYICLRPLHWAAVSCAALAAAVDLWRRPFHWSKTAHGRRRLSTTPARARA